MAEKQFEEFPVRLKTVIGEESIPAFAKRAGVTDSLMRAYLRGDSLPGMEKLFHIATAGNVRVEWLVTGEPPMRANTPSDLDVFMENLNESGRRAKRAADTTAIRDVLARIGKAVDTNDLVISEFAAHMGLAPEAIKEAVLLAGEYTMVPRHDVKAAAGDAVLLPADEVVDFLLFKTAWLRRELGIDPKGAVVIQAKGDSMVPSINDGDLLLVDVNQQLGGDDGVYVINMAGRVMVKRLQFLVDGAVEVVSDNPRYKPQVVKPTGDEQFWIVGRVVWSGGRL